MNYFLQPRYLFLQFHYLRGTSISVGFLHGLVHNEIGIVGLLANTVGMATILNSTHHTVHTLVVFFIYHAHPVVVRVRQLLRVHRSHRRRFGEDIIQSQFITRNMVLIGEV